MTRVVFLCALLAMLSVLGWVWSGAISSSSDAESQQWRVPEYGQEGTQEYQSFARKLRSSDIFKTRPNSKKSTNLEEAGDVSDQEFSDFPEVRGVSIIDGQPYVLLDRPEEAPSYFTIDDLVDNKWTIKHLNMREVVAYYEQEEKEYTFFITGSHLVSDTGAQKSQLGQKRED